jgi:hypothetical protein
MKNPHQIDKRALQNPPHFDFYQQSEWYCFALDAQQNFSDCNPTRGALLLM